MKLVLYIFFALLITCTLNSQSITSLKNRFNTYLNFNGSLNSQVAFSDNSVSILSAGKPEFTVFTDEQQTFSLLLTSLKPSDFTSIYTWKKNKHLTNKQLDSLTNTIKTEKKTNLSLAGKKIAIDPGHFAGNMDVARIEQKFLDFTPTPANGLKDTIRISEGILTYETADILKHKLEEQGAIVFMTRPKQNYTSFQITYDEWFNTKRLNVFDSLNKAGAMDLARKNKLIKLSKNKLFWEFFRDYELLERSRIINEFKPDITIIIHYNVDEKNTDWKNPTHKNYTMTFIGGGMTGDNLSKQINKNHFLRLLLSNQLNESEKLSSLTVNEFHKQMNIPIAKQHDASYLSENCLKTPSPGVFCRNLVLCRTINSTLVYGECLYQDNINECVNLNKSDLLIYEQKVPKRIYEAANCYYNAINMYFSNQ